MRKNTNGSYFVSWKHTTGNGHYAQGELVQL
jgi:sarcosine oxidase delta subunit